MVVRSLLRCLLLLLLSLAACSRERRPGPLFQDRFGDPGSGWGRDSREEFDRGYQDGVYFIEVYKPSWLAWANPGRRFDDVVVEVEARQVSGSADGHFGVLCRYRAPGDFYYFAVTEDGYYGILLVTDGHARVLTDEGFQFSPAIPTGGATEIIRGICQGTELRLYVNGQQVAGATDETLSQGDVGLAVGSGPAGSIRVHFDQFRVTAPEEDW